MRCINSSGFGVDTETLRVRHQSKGLARRNYLVAFLIVLSRLKPIVAEIDCDGEAISGSFCWVLAMNSPRIGGGTRITPDASIEDGLLDVLLVKEMSKLNMLRFMPSAVRGRHLHMPWCIYRQARRLSVRAADSVEYIALDGEEYYWGKRDVEFSCIPGGIRFLR
jgi:diacylglycerol kinase (ATP)